jgi:hypothetical protein
LDLLLGAKALTCESLIVWSEFRRPQNISPLESSSQAVILPLIELHRRAQADTRLE